MLRSLYFTPRLDGPTLVIAPASLFLAAAQESFVSLLQLNFSFNITGASSHYGFTLRKIENCVYECIMVDEEKMGIVNNTQK